MIPINGKTITKDFSGFIKVSDLIYFEGPLLSHYISPAGENYLFYWCDVDDLHNRWIIFRTDLLTIQNYVEKKISLKEIINHPTDDFVYIVDIDDNLCYNNVQLLLANEIPTEYIPQNNSYFDFEIKDSISLAGLSQKYSCGILEIHISGRDVRYGCIPLNKLAPLLPKIDEIRKGMAAKFIKYNKSKQIDKTKRTSTDQQLKLDTQYEFMYSMAGSIRVILKPMNLQRNLELEGVGTYADSFAGDFAGLFASGFSKEEILGYSQKYDKQLIKKYNDLIKFLYQEELSIGINWCNVGADINYSTNINKNQTREILANLSDFDYDTKETIEMTGRFYSLNIRSGSYAFESTDGDEERSNGRLDDLLKEIAYGISFNKTYTVSIERKSIVPIGQKKKIEDTIIYFKEIIDD